MNGGHDVGGMHGFGSIPGIEANEVFHDQWEGRVFALSIALGALGLWTMNHVRAVAEDIPPDRHLRLGYYERWLIRIQRMVAEYGLATSKELSSATSLGPARPTKAPLEANDVASAFRRGLSGAREPASPPRFKPGDRVRFKVVNPRGHTRLPRYVRGLHGRVDEVLGHFVFADAEASTGGEAPQWIYAISVPIAAIEESYGNTVDTIVIDAYESYMLLDE